MGNTIPVQCYMVVQLTTVVFMLFASVLHMLYAHIIQCMEKKERMSNDLYAQ